MQRINREDALKQKDAEIKSKKGIIQAAIANKFTFTVKRKEKELEELYNERSKILRA